MLEHFFFLCDIPFAFFSDHCSLFCRCYLQKRVLNLSKGPAVRALRAQTDKREYAMEMKKIVERLPFSTYSFCVHFLLSLHYYIDLLHGVFTSFCAVNSFLAIRSLMKYFEWSYISCFTIPIREARQNLHFSS